MAVQALAIFWYLESHNPKWKRSGIKDEDLHEVNVYPTPSGERDSLQ